MERNFKMYCVDVNKDGSEFELVFEMNERIVDIETVYCFDDVLNESGEFFRKNCEKYNFDGRRDKLEINIKYKY